MYILDNYYLRRTQAEEKQALPQLNAIIQVLDFQYPEERELYDLIHAHYKRRFKELQTSKRKGTAQLMEGLVRMRQACIHARLFYEGVQKRQPVKRKYKEEDVVAQGLESEECDEDFEKEWSLTWQRLQCDNLVEEEPTLPDEAHDVYRQGLQSMKDVPVVDIESLINGIEHVPDDFRSTKIEWLVRDITKHHNTEKTVVFFSFTEELKIVKKMLVEKNVPALTYQGDMSREDKEKALYLFNTTDISVFLMQIKCGGVGINLQAASRVYITCPNYNPCMDMQAIGRVYRKGQKKEVTAVRIVMKGTIEERCLEISEKKVASIRSTLGDDCTRILNHEMKVDLNDVIKQVFV